MLRAAGIAAIAVIPNIFLNPAVPIGTLSTLTESVPDANTNGEILLVLRAVNGLFMRIGILKMLKKVKYTATVFYELSKNY